MSRLHRLVLAAALALGAAHPADAAPAPAGLSFDVLGAHGAVPGVPTLATFRPDASHGAWTAIKDNPNPASQLRAVRTRGLAHTICTGLVDMRALVASTHAAFGFRDNVRGRSWGRPSMALVLLEAMDRFTREHPDKRVAIGDISQPGCGQLEHGTLIRLVNGDEAVALAMRARIALSAPTVVDELRAGDLPDEADRFDDGDVRLRLEQVVLARAHGAGGDLTLRVAQRRHRALSPPYPDELAALEAEVRRITRPANQVAQSRAWTADDDGRLIERWTTHWVDRRSRRQLVAVTADKPPRRVTPSATLELRLSAWRPKQPGSFPGEVRWVRATGPEGWERWGLLYEAGHISHHSGLDADLGYVTVDNTRHFAVDLDAMDVAATWRWFELLVAAGAATGHPVELILVDAKVRRHLARHLPPATRKGPLFTQILRISGGHDGHHHLRLVASTPNAERRAARALDRRVALNERRTQP